MNNKSNRIVMSLMAIAATLTPTINRVTKAKQEAFRLLGSIPTGVGRYRQVCPKGAGQGPKTQRLEEQTQVGSRTFLRRRASFIKGLRGSPWYNTLHSR